MPSEPYDPLDYQNLAQSVVGALLAQDAHPLPPTPRFRGSGVYALYYLGDFPPYARIAGPGLDTPIYVGCAVPKGARKGRRGEDQTSGAELHTRLAQHAKCIGEAPSLRIVDFRCRYLIVLPVWIRLAEETLIARYRPIWNTVIDGFGSHDFGGRRVEGHMSRWDTLHPGRKWVQKRRMQQVRSAQEILSELAAELDGR